MSQISASCRLLTTRSKCLLVSILHGHFKNIPFDTTFQERGRTLRLRSVAGLSSSIGDQIAPKGRISTAVENVSTENSPHTEYTQTSSIDPGLYLVATPIGNLEDITLRALRILRNASAILAEDTRHSQKLLRHYNIQTRTFSFHEHNEREREEKVVQLLQAGQAIALISDAGFDHVHRAGMPLISDPGSDLVRRVAKLGVKIYPIPGPSAVLTALVASGLPANQFHYCGFLPPKQVARQKAIASVKDITAVLVFFAPPHSLVAILSDLAAILGDQRRCAIARELTKVHEEFHRGSLKGLLEEFTERIPKGEITIVVEGCQQGNVRPEDAFSDEDIREKLQELMNDGYSASSAAKKISKDLEVPKNRVYSLATLLKE